MWHKLDSKKKRKIFNIFMYNLSFGWTKTEFYEKIWKCQVTDLLFFESSHQKVFSHNLLSKFQCVVVPYRISNVLYILLVVQLKCHFGLSKFPNSLTITYEVRHLENFLRKITIERKREGLNSFFPQVDILSIL